MVFTYWYINTINTHIFITTRFSWYYICPERFQRDFSSYVRFYRWSLLRSAYVYFPMYLWNTLLEPGTAYDSPYGGICNRVTLFTFQIFRSYNRLLCIFFTYNDRGNSISSVNIVFIAEFRYRHSRCSTVCDKEKQSGR